MVLEFFRSVFGLTSSFVKIPVVKAEEDDEEEELEDPLTGLRAACEKEKEAVALLRRLEECNARVRSKKKTAETCEEEIHEFVHFVDSCAAKDLFKYLK